MDRASTGARSDLGDEAATLVDRAAALMRRAGLTGPLAGGSIEFLFDEAEHVRGWYAKTRGGRRDLEATWAAGET